MQKFSRRNPSPASPAGLLGMSSPRVDGHPHWTAKVEYVHYDLGSVTYGVGPLVTNAVVAAPFTSNALQSATSFSGDVVRTGVNYKF
jgi:hypothetical protein